MNGDQPGSVSGGIQNPWVLDAIACDRRAGRIVLAMFETRPWDGSDRQRLQLQEKLNAYVSFILDGEMSDAYPDLAGQPVTIQLRTVHQPDALALEFLRMAREQLSFQEIELETVLAEGGVPARMGISTAS